MKLINIASFTILFLIIQTQANEIEQKQRISKVKDRKSIFYCK